ncbi:MAG: nucleotidyltransferase domain-containing protein [Candidatus Omnitrophica bacterium]|nr:nucleotidyltransferase domain-containing protein [Candidatus Omnitrophota bacterium]
MEKARLHKKIKRPIEDFTAALKDIYRDGLVSIILYGSAASGEFIEKGSNINLLVVLDDTGLENLRRALRVINKRAFRLIKPVFFTERYIKSSLDVFPLEFLDMKENYSVLTGKDVLSGLEISVKNLRFQCEQELKAKLLLLKNGYLAVKNKAALKGLLFRSFTSIVHILRNLLRLKGKVPPYQKESALEELEIEFGIDMAHFRKILRAKKKKIRLFDTEVESLFFGLVADLEKIIYQVDAL